jgi:4'-phosphopantetheinyl transferase
LLSLDDNETLVGEAERTAALRLGDEVLRRERLAAHAALRLLCRRAFGPRLAAAPFARTPAGRPFLPDVTGSFSLSHTSGAALIALATAGAVGVDVERRRRAPAPSARWQAVCAAGEALVSGAPPAAPTVAAPTVKVGDHAARLVAAWVRLEAVAKARGHGVGRLLAMLGVRGAAPCAAKAADAARALLAGSGGETPVRVADVMGLGPDLFAACAATAGAALPARLRHLPATAAALRDIAAGCDGG